MPPNNDNPQPRGFWARLLDWLPVMPEIDPNDVDPENLLGIREMILRHQLEQALGEQQEANRHMPSPIRTPPLPEIQPPPQAWQEQLDVSRLEFERLKMQIEEDRDALHGLTQAFSRAIIELQQDVRAVERLIERPAGSNERASQTESDTLPHVTLNEEEVGEGIRSGPDDSLRRRRSRVASE